MNEDDRMDAFLRRWAGEYNRPPETPREEMWREIRSAVWPEVVGEEKENVVPLPRRSHGRTRTPAWRAWRLAAAGAAAVLVLGFGLGRWSAPGGEEGPGDAGSEGAAPSMAFRTAALSHFSETESFLTLVRGDARSGRVDPGVGRWAEGFLSQTRLLLDSPAARDPAVRELLEDLELVLMQVAGVEAESDPGSGRARREIELLAEGMDDRGVLSRLRAMVPEGPAPLGL